MGHLAGSCFISVLLFNDFRGTFFLGGGGTFIIDRFHFKVGEAGHVLFLMSSHRHLLSEQIGNYGNKQGQHSTVEFECRQNATSAIT